VRGALDSAGRRAIIGSLKKCSLVNISAMSQLQNKEGQEVEFLSELAGFNEEVISVTELIRKSLRAAMRDALGGEELSPNEIEVLVFLRQRREDDPDNTAREIARVRGRSRSLVSKSVDSLVKRGYIETKQDLDDRRVVRLSLLPRAEDTVEKLAGARERFLNRLCAGITQEEFDAFHAIVKKIEQNVKNNLSEPGRERMKRA